MAFQSALHAGQPSNSVCAEYPHRAAPEDAVGALFLGSAQLALLQHRPDQESNAQRFLPVAGSGPPP
jgi:hypothetical protein